MKKSKYGGGIFIKKFFKKLLNLEDDSEDDGIEIINGVVYYKNQKEETKNKNEKIAERQVVKENVRQYEIKKEYKVENLPLEENLEEVEKVEGEINYDDEVENENLEGIKELEKSKGRARKIDGFYLSLKASGRSKNTIESYKYDIKFWEKASKNKSIYSLKYRDIEMAISPLDINTAKRRVSSLKQLAKWYLRDGFPLLHIETEKVMLGKGKSRLPKSKDKDEFIRIREESKELIKQGKREGIWLGLGVMCGLRISEIKTVEVFEKKFITVVGKGDKERQIPCPDWLVKALLEFKKDGTKGYHSNRRIVDSCLRKMGYTHFHTLRHTFATMLVRNAVPLVEIQKLLGHSDISTTTIYAKVDIKEGTTKVLDELTN